MLDLRAAFAHLRRRPFGIGATLLALFVGVGLNSAVYSVLRSSFSNSLGLLEINRLVSVAAAGEGGKPRDFLTTSEVSAIRDSGVLAETATVERWPASRRAWLVVNHGDASRRVPGGFVTPNLFKMLGVQLALGRDFGQSDVDSQEPVVIATYGFWRDQLGSPALDAAAVSINGSSRRLIGVLPSDFVPPVGNLSQRFSGLERIALWLPQDAFQMKAVSGAALTYELIGRLRPGIAQGSAEADLRERVHQRATELRITTIPVLVPLRDRMLGWVRGTMVILGALAALLLALAILIVVMVSLLRLAEMETDLAIRAALGAPWRRIASLPLFETIIVSAVAVASSFVAFVFGRGALISLLPLPPWSSQVRGDLVGASAVALTALVLAGCGTLAAASFALGNPSRTLRKTASGGSRAFAMHERLLLIGQAACVTSLLIPGLSLILALWQANAVRGELATSRVIAAEMWIVDEDIRREIGVTDLEDRLVETARSWPGVERVGASSDLPMLGTSAPTYRPSVADGTRRRDVMAFGESVDGEYFQVMRIPLVAGRLLDHGDRKGSELVAVISETLAKQAFGASNAVDRRISFHGDRRVVGVVKDRHFTVGATEGLPTLYLSRYQEPQVRFSLFVEMTGSVPDADIVKRLEHIDALQPIDRVIPVRDLVNTAYASQRVFSRATVLLGVAGLILAGAGVYVVSAYSMTRRRKEIGIRLAIGATRRGVVAAFVWSFARAIVPGALTLGLPMGIVLRRIVEVRLAPLPSAPMWSVPVAAALVILFGAGVVAISAWRSTAGAPIDYLRE